MARRPKRASLSGCRAVRDRPQDLLGQLVEAGGQRPKSRRQADPSAPRPAAVVAPSSGSARPPDRRRAGGRGRSAASASAGRARRVERPQERRAAASGVERRALVVQQAGQGQLAAAGPAADPVRGLEHGDPTPARARVTAAASPLGPEPTTTASVTTRRHYGRPWAQPGRTGAVATSIVGRRRARAGASHVLDPDVALLDRAGGRVDYPVVLPLPVDRLRLQQDDPQVAVCVSAPLLDCARSAARRAGARRRSSSRAPRRPRSRPRHLVRVEVSTARGSSPFSARPWWCIGPPGVAQVQHQVGVVRPVQP